MYCLFCVVLCIVCVYMCPVLLPQGSYPVAVKYIISYQSFRRSSCKVSDDALPSEAQNVGKQIIIRDRLLRSFSA